jgi:N-acetylmuramoyl-L-alanine amidase
MKKYWLAALAPWMAMSAALAQEAAPRPEDAKAVRIQYTYYGVSTDEGARVGEEVFAAPSVLRNWGWDVATRYSDADITMEERTLRVKMIIFRGRPMVSLSEAARAAGARTQWSQDGSTYMIRSWIRNIELTREGIRVDGTLPVRPKAFRLDNPNRFIIDLEGAEFDPLILSPLPSGWRAGQLNDTTVRVVVEHPEMGRQPVPRLIVGRSVSVPLMSVNPQATAGLLPAPSNTITRPAATPALPKGTPIAQIVGVQMQGQTSESVSVLLPIRTGRAGTPVGVYRSVNAISLRIPNSHLDQDVSFGSNVSPLIRSIRAREISNSVTEVFFETTRPLGFDFQVNGDSVSLKVFVPPMTQGGLAGRVIVLDPGHGGRDPGAQMKGANEKAIVLKLGRFLTEELTKMGATVIVTRTDDTFVALNERPAVANRNNASLFISLHVNSNTVANTASGSKMFFHRRDSLGMLLATAVDAEFKRLDRLPSMGTWSDTRIYRSGFAVLRAAQMPSLLVETGFINNDRDRAVLITEAYQRSMAKAIARGVAVFMGIESGD